MNSKFDAKYNRITFFEWDGKHLPASIITSAINRPMVEQVDFIIENEDYDEMKLVLMLGYAFGVSPRGTQFRLSVPKKLSVELPLPFEVYVNDQN